MTEVKAELVGSVWKITAKPGDQVAEDDTLLILESMKMEIPVMAPRAGTVKEIRVKETDVVKEGEVLVVLERPSPRCSCSSTSACSSASAGCGTTSNEPTRGSSRIRRWSSARELSARHVPRRTQRPRSCASRTTNERRTARGCARAKRS